MPEVDALAKRVDAVLDAAPDAMVLVDAAGRIVLFNHEAERLFGYTRAEVLGREVELLVPDRFRATHPGHRRSYADDPRTRPMGAGVDLSARRRDGSEFPAEISLSRVELDEETFTMVAIRDVTQRRKVESKFRLLLEAAPDAIVIVDPNGHIVIVNARAEAMFGHSREDLVGRSVDLLVPRRASDRHGEHRRRYVEDPRPRPMGSDVDLFAVRKDGTEFPVEISLSPLDTEDGMLISSAIRDVTKRRETERALKLAYKELESFSYSIAHDLRAPLRGMNGFAQVLATDHADKLDADALECLDEIRANAVRMGSLIDALLSLSRVSRTDLRRDRIDLANLARTAFLACESAEPDRVVELVVAEPLPISIDVALGRALMSNLVGNAWKFTARVADARIEVGAEQRAGERTFYVRDNGVGFDMAYAGKLFAPFQRLHPDREFAGTGIGLATAQRIVHRHGGRIWAEGAVGQGATVRFTIPESGAQEEL